MDGEGFSWSEDKAQTLQDVCDAIFKPEDAKASKLRFSFTIADPFAEGCPLVGCSTGFKDLCGYGMDDIVGHNCRFLVDPVPETLVDAKTRERARKFCQCVRDGEDYELSPEDVEPWMPEFNDGDNGIFCVQMNARKNGDLFRNMFFMKTVHLSDKAFIIGLQTELPESDVSVALRIARRQLEENMAEVERVLASMFWFESSMRRQDDRDPEDGFVFDPVTNRFAPAKKEDTFTETQEMEEPSDDAVPDKGEIIDGNDEPQKDKPEAEAVELPAIEDPKDSPRHAVADRKSQQQCGDCCIH